MEDNLKIKVFTAFSGYDSQCLALELLSETYPNFEYELIGWSEIDKYAIKAHNVLLEKYTDKNYGDISKIDWTEVPDFDLFTYSSPCQDFSLAGKQRGGEEGSGTRSSLLWECERCIKEKRPKYLILENVTALVSDKFMPVFEKWMNRVASYGYENFYQTMNSRNYNVAQNRDRVFLVSIRKDDEEIIDYDFPNEFDTKPTIETKLEKNVDAKYFVDQKKVNQWVKDNQERIINYICKRENISRDDFEIEIEFEDDEEISDLVNNTEVTESSKEENFISSEDTNKEVAVESIETKPKAKRMKKQKPKNLRGGHLVRQIPTPTTSYGAAPTIMATGYGSASYKNFYSVGHFPKLGLIEVWSDGSDIVKNYTNNQSNKLL